MTERESSAENGRAVGAPEPLALQERPTNIVVGIGASAGGLAALKEMFATIPADSGLAFVVVVHLAVNQESHLADLLQPHTSIPVGQVTGDTAIEPNRAYVIPPGRYITAVDSHLRLAPLPDARVGRAPVNHFFRTLAETHDGSSVGVILSGSGNDGAEGIRYIRGQGGLTIAQDPGEAEFDGMPQSAINTGLVDRVLRVSDIIGQIVEFSRTKPDIDAAATPRPVPGGPSPDPLQTVLTVLRVRTGQDFLRYKPSTVGRRVSRRMQVHNLTKIEDYLALLRADEKEGAALFDDLLINVTSFFRDPQVFRALEARVIPSLFEGKGRADSVRVWSVGCSTGEEPYSLAMLLLEEAAKHDNPPQIHVFATDLHERSLQKGRDALFDHVIESEVSPERLQRFFRRESTGYRVVKALRDVVVFATHNVLRDPPFSRLDLIVCRNVLIYLQRDVQNEIIDVFHYGLRSGGRLLLGTAETIDRSDLFSAEAKETRIYRRRDTLRAAMRVPSLPLRATDPRVDASLIPAPTAPPATVDAAFAGVHQRMLLQESLPSLLVAPDHEVVHLSNGVGRYLQHGEGEPTSDLFKLVRPEFSTELRAALHVVLRERRVPWQSRPIAARIEGQNVAVTLHVSPTSEPEFEGFALVIFDESAQAGGTLPAGVDPPDDPARELEIELNSTRSRMQAVIEEFETTQEEMRAANEELQSTNEELRSTMEELETSREELQSVNEELQTLNQENRHKVEELSQLSGDLQNLLNATDVATLFLDRNLRILRFSPRVAEIFNVRHSDRGRPLRDLTHRLGRRDLIDDAQHVLLTLVPIELNLQASDTDSHYLLRMTPYRTIDDRIDGVVITIVDITSLKRTEAALRRTEEREAVLVRLQDVLRGLTSPADIQLAGAQLLGEHLGLGRVAYVEMTSRGPVTQTYTAPSQPPSARFDGAVSAQYPVMPAADVVVADVSGDVSLSEAQRVAFDAAGTSASATLVLMDAGFPVAALVVESATPRSWVPQDLELIRQVMRRTWESADRARIAAALHLTQERHRLIIEGARDYAVLSLDANGVIESWSSGAEATFGWSAVEAIGAPFALTFTGEDRTSGVPAQEMATAREHGVAADVQWHLRKDQTRVFIDGSTWPLTNSAGQIDGFLKVGRDVTERMRTEESLGDALRMNRSNYRTLFTSIDQGFCVIDLVMDDEGTVNDYSFIDANPAFDRLTGFNGVVGRTLRDLVPRGEPALFEIFERVCRRGEPEHFRLQAVSLGGWVEAYAFRVGDAGGQRLGVLFRSIVEQRRAEQERDVFRSRLIQAEEDERRRLARELHDEAGQHITALGLGLQALSDVVAPNTEVARRAGELRELAIVLGRELHALAVRLRPKALDDFGLEAALRMYCEEWSRQTGISVQAHMAYEAARLTVAVETAVYRIVQEALTNVLRHSEATIARVLVERRDGHIAVSIEDNGRGFDSSSDAARFDAAAGLGLQGMRERASLLRGTMEIESEVNGGTTVFVRIPVDQAVERADANV